MVAMDRGFYDTRTETEKPASENIGTKVTINNPADITVIVGYFLMVIGVGIWVRPLCPLHCKFASQGMAFMCIFECIHAIFVVKYVASWI